MKKSAECPKCGSQSVIKGDRLFTFGVGTAKSMLSVETCEKPDALIFKKPHQGLLEAWVCVECGFTELYVRNPEEIKIGGGSPFETVRRS